MNEIRGDVRDSRQDGVILVIVLWILALLSVIASNFTLGNRLETQKTMLLRDGARADSLAEAGIWRGIFETQRVREQNAWEIDGTVHTFTMDDDTVRVAITEIGGLIDINGAQKPLLLNLLNSVEPDRKTARALTDALIDWRDTDNRRQPQGAEDGDYALAGLGYECKDGMFSTVDELELVLGFNNEMVRRLKPMITVHSQERKINLASAPPSVLAVIPGMNDEQVAAVLEARAAGQLDAAYAALPPTAQKYLSQGKGRTFVVRSEAAVGTVTSRFSVIVRAARVEGRPYTILSWSTDGLPLVDAGGSEDDA